MLKTFVPRLHDSAVPNIPITVTVDSRHHNYYPTVCYYYGASIYYTDNIIIFTENNKFLSRKYFRTSYVFRLKTYRLWNCLTANTREGP